MKTLRRYLPVILWSAIIFLFSSWETPPSPQDTLLNFLLKKTAHLIEYAILYYLTFHAANQNVRRTNNQQFQPAEKRAISRVRIEPKGEWQAKAETINNYLFPLIFTILYAVSDEIHQSFVSGRHGRAADVLIDAAGALLVMLKIRHNVLKSSLEPKDNDRKLTLNQRWSYEKSTREKSD